MPWWDLSHPGDVLRVVLLQVDLGRHSTWAANQLPLPEVCRERAKFAASLEFELRYLRFDLLFWAGDGGVFAQSLENGGGPRHVCDAADKVFDVFNSWVKKDWELQIRVTGTLIRDVSVDPKPGNWCSPEFNSFLKYERSIALPNTFVATRELVNHIRGSDKERFGNPREVVLPNGQVTSVFTDIKHGPTIRVSTESFARWLRDRAADSELSDVLVQEAETFRFRGSTVLHAAHTKSGYGFIIPELQRQRDVSEALHPSDILQWKGLVEELRQRRLVGTRTQLTRYIPPLTDDNARFRCSTITYAEARAFHQLLEDSREKSSAYRDSALRVLDTNGTNIPNNLSVAIVVILGSRIAPELLIALREERTGTYNAGSWSVSIAEQFRPVAHLESGRDVRADATILDAAVRGLREELLGDAFDKEFQVSAHALLLEDDIDNFQFLVIADLRPLHFGTIRKTWAIAIDAAEHSALASIPASRGCIFECMRSDTLPRPVWIAAMESEKAAFREAHVVKDGSLYTWQPCVRAKLAACLWYLEQD